MYRGYDGASIAFLGGDCGVVVHSIGLVKQRVVTNVVGPEIAVPCN